MPPFELVERGIDSDWFNTIQPLRFDVYCPKLKNWRPVWVLEGSSGMTLLIHDGNNQGKYVVRPQHVYTTKQPSWEGMNINKHGLQHTLVMVGNSMKRVQEYCGRRSSAYLDFLVEDLLPGLREYAAIPEELISLGTSAGGTISIEGLAKGYWGKAIAISLATRGKGTHIEQLLASKTFNGSVYVDTTNAGDEAPFTMVYRIGDILTRNADTYFGYVRGRHSERSQTKRVPAALAAVDGASLTRVHMRLTASGAAPWFVIREGPGGEGFPPLADS